MMELSVFYDKLNKVDGKVYAIEEEIRMPDNGIYEAELQHDNIVDSTLAVYTGPTLTGEQIQTYALSTPSLMPWKRIIRIQTDVPVVYVSYETDGDTVEAQDVNVVQDAILETQGGVNAEEARAKSAEMELNRNLQAETERATGEEQRLDIRIDTEAGRAQDAENALSIRLDAETERAEAAEQENADAIAAEASRAKVREGELQGSIDTHVAAVNGEVQALKAADTALDERKANASDVNRELADRYTKSQVFTKDEVLQKIEDLIGTAPDTLDTFKEIADALGNDPNFAATIMNLLAGKVDKETGKQLTSNDYSDSEKAIVADVNAKKHSHNNKSVLDKVTQSLLDAWNAAYNHISDTVKHVTAAERNNWDDANSKKHTHSNKGVIDKLTQAMLDKLTGIAAGAEVNVQADWGITDIVSDAYIKNKPTSLPANGGIASQLSNAVMIDDYDALIPTITSAGKITPVKGTASSKSPWNNTNSGFLIESNSGDSAHLLLFRSGGDGWAYRSWYRSSWGEWKIWSTFDGKYSSLAERPTSFPPATHSHVVSQITDFPTSLPASDVQAWAKAASKPSYGWSEISGKPSSFTPAAHTHTKSQITDMPTKVSAFENDAGYVTAADINTSQNHTHANKSVLDTITQALLNNWNAAYTHISNKSNPHGVTAAQVGALESLQLSNSDNLDEIKIPGFYFAGGSNAVTGKPSGTDAFGLQVYKTASGYITQDLIAGTGNPYKRYTRQWSNSVWSNWIPLPTFTSAPVSGQVVISDGVTGGIKSSGFTIAKSVPSNAAFTDTVYTHPNSGVTAGTYKSVTVNAQGHVTGGTNPTTLAGYGITDAAAKNHNHDSTYLKKTGLTWDDLKGV